MPIQFRCQTCRKLLSVARRKAGHDTECPVCGSKTQVPGDIQEGPTTGSTSTHPEMVAAPTAGESLPAPTAVRKDPSGTSTPAIGTQPAAKPSPAKPKRVPGSSGILEIDPDRLFGKSQSRGPIEATSLQKPAKELSDYFEAIDQSQEMDDSGSQAIEIPEPFLNKSNSWQLRFFAVVAVVVLAAALVVGILLIRGW